MSTSTSLPRCYTFSVLAFVEWYLLEKKSQSHPPQVTVENTKSYNRQYATFIASIHRPLKKTFSTKMRFFFHQNTFIVDKFSIYWYRIIHPSMYKMYKKTVRKCNIKLFPGDVSTKGLRNEM